MNDALSMGLVERIGNFTADSKGLKKRHRSTTDPVGEGFALEILHHQEIDARMTTDVVEHADVRVIQVRNRFGFAFESGLEVEAASNVGGQHLDSHRPAQACVGRFVDLTHAACTKRSDNRREPAERAMTAAKRDYKKRPPPRNAWSSPVPPAFDAYQASCR